MATLSRRAPAYASAGTVSCIQGHVKRGTVLWHYLWFVSAIINAVVSC